MMQALLRNVRPSRWWRIGQQTWARWTEADGDQRAAAFAFLFCGVIVMYKLAPSRHTRYSEVWLGALGATVTLWLGYRQPEGSRPC